MSSETHSEATTLRAAIIGYGLAGSVFHAPLIAATPGINVAAIVTNNSERRQRAQRDYPTAAVLASANEIWQAPELYDLVIVASTNRSHVPLAMAAMEAGTPVVVDKPLAPSVSEAERLVATSERSGVPLTVFQNRRWDGDFLTVRHILDKGLLGHVAGFDSRYERYRPTPRPGSWRERPDPEEAGGLLFDLGSHVIDQALVLFGTPNLVYAEMRARRPGALVDDDTFVALQFPSGVRVHLWMNTVVRVLGPRFQVNGLRGSYVKYGVDPQEDALRRGARPGDPGWGLEPRESWGRLETEIEGAHVDGAIETRPGSYEQFYVELREALTQGTPLPVDPHQVVTTLRVIEGARDSARSGTTVTFGKQADHNAETTDRLSGSHA